MSADDGLDDKTFESCKKRYWRNVENFRGLNTGTVPAPAYTTFESWFDETEGFTLRSERFYDYLGPDNSWATQGAREWLKAAFEAGREAAQARIGTLEVTVSGAAAKFREYERLHAAKPDMVKAKANGDFAAVLESVLDPNVIYLTVACDPSKLPPVRFDPPHGLSGPVVEAARRLRDGLDYPPNGGLKPQVRELEETQSIFALLRREYERERTRMPSHLRAVDPKTLRDPRDEDFDALRERVQQHAADLKALLGIEHEARILRRVAAEIADERDTLQKRLIDLEERLDLPAIEARIAELDARVRAILTERGPVQFDMARASELAAALEIRGSAAQAVLDAAGGHDAQDRG
jgi:hypothetical protein